MPVIVWQKVARLALGKILGDKSLKDRTIADLRAKAKLTETEFDDAAVDALEKAWDPIVAIVLGKVG